MRGFGSPRFADNEGLPPPHVLRIPAAAENALSVPGKSGKRPPPMNPEALWDRLVWRDTAGIDVGDHEAGALLPLAPSEDTAVGVRNLSAALEMAGVTERGKLRHRAREAATYRPVNDRSTDVAAEHSRRACGQSGVRGLRAMRVSLRRPGRNVPPVRPSHHQIDTSPQTPRRGAPHELPAHRGADRQLAVSITPSSSPPT